VLACTNGPCAGSNQSYSDAQVVTLGPALQLKHQLDDSTSRRAAVEGNEATQAALLSRLKSDLARKTVMLQAAKAEVAQLTAVSDALERRPPKPDVDTPTASRYNWQAVAKGIQDLSRIVLRSVAVAQAGACCKPSSLLGLCCDAFRPTTGSAPRACTAGSSALVRSQQADGVAPAQTGQALPLGADQIAELVGLSAGEVCPLPGQRASCLRRCFYLYMRHLVSVAFSCTHWS
jgi:hypothetical protein